MAMQFVLTCDHGHDAWFVLPDRAYDEQVGLSEHGQSAQVFIM